MGKEKRKKMIFILPPYLPFTSVLADRLRIGNELKSHSATSSVGKAKSHVCYP